MDLVNKKSSSSGGKKGKSNRGTLVESYRERELSYERTHPEALIRHAGHWVALEGETVVASSANLTETIAEARASGIKIPYVFYISGNDDAALGL